MPALYNNRQQPHHRIPTTVFCFEAQPTENTLEQNLTCFDWHFHCLYRYPVIQKLFLQFNTALPSSAPVERLFIVLQILTPGRNRLTPAHFEHQLLRANKCVFRNWCFYYRLTCSLQLCALMVQTVLTDSCNWANFSAFRITDWNAFCCKYVHLCYSYNWAHCNVN